MKIVREVELPERRCYDCGRWWACDSYGGGEGTCPRCATVAVREANARADKAERSMRGLRGSLTKLQAKRGGK